MSDAIVFDGVRFSYGRKKVLDTLSFTVNAGERICLFGPSGCGKTTVLRLICGLEKPDSGTVTVNGSIRPVFQEDRLLPFLTVRENVCMFAGEGSADTVLARLGLREAADEYPARLSGGMSRRAAIARALAGQGDIYIFDEPFNGLDDVNTEKAIDLIREYTDGKTAVFILHDIDDADRLGCRMIEVKHI